MTASTKNILGAAACVLLAAIASARADELTSQPGSPEATVHSGTLAGTAEEGVLAFKGIPYAAPPVGALRWQPPQPAASWSGLRDAKTYAPDCMQILFPGDAAPPRTTPGEDCLYLNVWRPANDAKNLPVMVWIYGGGFVIGGTSPAVYDGAHFARDGVVFVSLNYRLGRFGFFAFPALTAENPGGLHGNYGYMDQIAALRWVRDNIAAFGGDPNNVTVFGESAGGGSVHMLLSSPLARGLFERAMIESGGGRTGLCKAVNLSTETPDSPSGEQVGANFAKSAGVDGTGPDALAALRALPASKLAEGVDFMHLIGGNGPPTYSGPMNDGAIVTMAPARAYEGATQAMVPILVGANSADIGFSFAKSKDELFAAFGEDARMARATYDPSGDAPLNLLGWEVAMDGMMVEPARFTAQEFAAIGLPAYEYRFSYISPVMAAQLDKPPMSTMMPVKGAPHASEIPYAFDTVEAAYGSGTTDDDRATAAKVHAYWVNFAKTGNPNGNGLPNWPSYARESDTLMNFTQQGPSAMKDPWATRLDVVAQRAERHASKSSGGTH